MTWWCRLKEALFIVALLAGLSALAAAGVVLLAILAVAGGVALIMAVAGFVLYRHAGLIAIAAALVVAAYLVAE